VALHSQLMFAVLLTTLAKADSRVCAGCHRKIWETYAQTGMGRSFYRLTPERLVEDFVRKNTYFHAPSESYFTMSVRDGQCYQRRYQLDAAGKPVNVMELRVDYVMGSGNSARAYLHRTDSGRLLELPLGWYAEKGGYWGMNPGYDRADHDGFRRPISYDCMFCHNAYPKIPAGNEQPFAEAIYQGELPEGIDCQRCHGDGIRHVQLAGAGAKREEIRKAIVHPGRLRPERQMEICMACHLETTSFPLPNALQRYDRGPFSFGPGERLGNFLLNFDHAPGRQRDDKFEIVSAAYRLRKSACFLKSAGKMICTTCHDPHRAQAAREYNEACHSCHAQGEHVKAQTDCTGCHMPKRRTEDVIHVVATDHYIQKKKPEGDLLAELRERKDEYRGPVVPYYPAKLPAGAEGELYLAVAQVKQSSNLKAGIPQLTAAIDRHAPKRGEWYLELAEALDHERKYDQALLHYREAARRSPASGYALQKLGTALRRTGRNEEAVQSLLKAAELAPERALTWHELGLVYRAEGKTAEAVDVLQKAIKKDPQMYEAWNNLGILRLSETDFREAIRIRPDYADAHGNLAQLLASQGKTKEAESEFETALRLRPVDAATHYNYAMMLGRGAKYGEAKRELERSLEADPEFSDAREMLADLLLGMGQERAAIAQYREALRRKPESGRALSGLGTALAAVGEREEAVVYLRRAEANPAWKERARQVLRGLGK
jgi:tetratricopeptide (TPR) repeat protein